MKSDIMLDTIYISFTMGFTNTQQNRPRWANRQTCGHADRQTGQMHGIIADRQDRWIE